MCILFRSSSSIAAIVTVAGLLLIPATSFTLITIEPSSLSRTLSQRGSRSSSAPPPYSLLLPLREMAVVQAPISADADAAKENEKKIPEGSKPSTSVTTTPIGSSRGKIRDNLIVETMIVPEEIYAKKASPKIIQELELMRCTVSSCPEIWDKMAEICPNLRAVYDEHFDGEHNDRAIELTFKELNYMISKCAVEFQRMGVSKGDNVAVFAENCAYWLLVDQAIQRCGGITVVRGAEAAPLDELRYIYENCQAASDVVVLQSPKLLEKLIVADGDTTPTIGLESIHGLPQTVICLHPGDNETYSEEKLQSISNRLGGNIRIKFIHEIIDDNHNNDGLDPVTSARDSKFPSLTRRDLSTIVYTSGTTGRPKGVMLTHGNLLHQIRLRFCPTQPFGKTEPIPGNSMVCLLPIWHITERTAELIALTRGCSLVYTNIKCLKSDLTQHKPECMVLVPRVLEKIHDEIQKKVSSKPRRLQKTIKFFMKVGISTRKHSKIARGLVVGDTKPGRLKRLRSRLVWVALAPFHKLGNKLVWKKVRMLFGGHQKVVFSGGSALSGNLEQFYEAAGLNVLVGYGLTECSPVIAHRRGDTNLVEAGCVGVPSPATEIRIANSSSNGHDEEERPALNDGEVGLVLVRGPQVMAGYYNNEKKTSEVIDKYGWFDTGDLGKINPATGDLFIIGREKDTIVLANGENVEPIPIEDAILASSNLIDQVMLVGQEEKSLTAIAVLNPTVLANDGYVTARDGESLQKAIDQLNNPSCTPDEYLTNASMLETYSKKLRSNHDLIRELQHNVKEACVKFRPWEHVHDIYITLEPFAMSNGLLTQSYKVKRDKVFDRYYANLIEEGLIEKGPSSF